LSSHLLPSSIVRLNCVLLSSVVHLDLGRLPRSQDQEIVRMGVSLVQECRIRPHLDLRRLDRLGPQDRPDHFQGVP